MKSLCLTLCVVYLFVSLTSCVKEKDLVLAPPASTAASFATTQAPDSFNWSTTRTVKVQFTGEAEAEYELVFNVALSDGTVVYHKAQKSTENFEGTVEIPAHVNALTLSYGSTVESVDCTNGTAALSITE